MFRKFSKDIKKRKVEIELDEEVAAYFDLLYRDNPIIKEIILSRFILNAVINDRLVEIEELKAKAKHYKDLMLGKEPENTPEATVKDLEKWGKE